MNNLELADFGISGTPGFAQIAFLTTPTPTQNLHGMLRAFLAPEDGLCDNPRDLQAKMLRLSRDLGRHTLMDECTQNCWGKLYYDRRVKERNFRLLMIVFPDPLVALGVALDAASEDRGGLGRMIVPDEDVRAQTTGLDRNNYNWSRPERTVRHRKDGATFVYPGGKRLRIDWPERPPMRTRWLRSL